MLRPNAKGFTIIEILIAVAIIGFILIIILLVVPTLRTNQRNTDRKSLVSFVSSQLEQYAHNNANVYPDTPAQFCAFITGYLAERVPGMGSCTPSMVGSKRCVLVDGSIYDICYHDRVTSSHSYIGPYDEISIQASHKCNNDPATSDDPPHYPITSVGDTDTNIKRYVVWTRLERSNAVYCLNN